MHIFLPLEFECNRRPEPSVLSVLPCHTENIIMSLDQKRLSVDNANKRDQLSREEWMELKPTIWRLFIQENRKLQHVVDLLRKQGFALT